MKIMKNTTNYKIQWWNNMYPVHVYTRIRNIYILEEKKRYKKIQKDNRKWDYLMQELCSLCLPWHVYLPAFSYPSKHSQRYSMTPPRDTHKPLRHMLGTMRQIPSGRGVILRGGVTVGGFSVTTPGPSVLVCSLGVLLGCVVVSSPTPSHSLRWSSEIR